MRKVAKSCGIVKTCGNHDVVVLIVSVYFSFEKFELNSVVPIINFWILFIPYGVNTIIAEGASTITVSATI